MVESPLIVCTFEPSWRRFVFFRLLVVFAAYQFFFTLFQLFSDALLDGPQPRQAWLASSAAFLVVHLLMLLRSLRRLNTLHSILIVDGMIEGPADIPRRRTRFPVCKVDKARTSRLNWLNWVLQYRYIWSTEGQRIALLSYAFEETQVQALLRQIGCQAENPFPQPTK
jgi:hypothetical protein